MEQRSLKRKAAVVASAVLLAAVLIGAAAVVTAGSTLAGPAQRRVGAPPKDLPAESVTFPSASGAILHGWFVPGEAGRGAIILMHPVRGNRCSMLSRARFVHAHGYSTLLFDFQAHGESPGDHITFGYLESRDAQAAVDFVRARLPDEDLAVVGVSLGGAACLLSEPALDVDAMVLEAAYPDIDRATRNRLHMRLGRPGEWLAPLLTVQFQPRLGFSPEDLRPIDHIGSVRCPVLIIAGARDEHTTLDESKALFAAAPEPKELWVVEDAAHADFHRNAKEAYEAKVLAFLERTLERRPNKDAE